MNTMHLARKPEGTPAENQRDDLNSEYARPQFDLHETLQMLWRQKKIIIATTLLIMIFVYAVITSLTPRYTASVFVEINPRQERVVDFEAVLSGMPASVETMQTEIAIIQSRKIARRAIENLGLNRSPEFNPALGSVGLLKSWRNSLADWLAGHGAALPEGLQSVPGKLRHLVRRASNGGRAGGKAPPSPDPPLAFFSGR